MDFFILLMILIIIICLNTRLEQESGLPCLVPCDASKLTLLLLLFLSRVTYDPSLPQRLQILPNKSGMTLIILVPAFLASKSSPECHCVVMLYCKGDTLLLFL